MLPDMATTGIYARQSMDSTKSIADQHADMLADADREGDTVAVSYADGTSASRFARRGRDDWQRVLDDIRGRRWEVLRLWESSRGDRTPESWLAFLSLCRERNVLIRIVDHYRTYDMRVARDWRTLAEDGIDNAYESEKTSRRVRRGQVSAAAAGRPSHGRCPDGYRRTYDPRTGKLDGQEIDEERAPVIREIFKRVAKGEPVSDITLDLNRRRVPSNAKQWYRSRVIEIARNPAYIGVRIHNREHHKGQWPAIVNDATFYAAQRVLDSPKRMKTRPGRQKYLLSYLATCGQCEQQRNAIGLAPAYMVGTVRGRYACVENGCVSIPQTEVDGLVTKVIIGLLSKPDVYKSLRQQGEEAGRRAVEARDEAARLRAQLDGWRLSAARGETSPESLQVIEADLSDRIRRAERRERELSVPLAVRSMVGPNVDVRLRWRKATMPMRREVIRLFCTVKIFSAKPSAQRGDRPHRVEITPT